MKKSVVGISALCVAGAMVFIISNSNAKSATLVGEQPVAGIALTIDTFYDTADKEDLEKLSNTVNLDSKARIATASFDDEEQGEPVMDLPQEQSEDELSEEEKQKQEDAKKYENMGIAKVDNHLNIRKEPGEDKKIIGKLPKDAGCYIYDIDKNGWAKIKSGKVTGYVKSDFLVMGEEVPALAEKVGMQIATVTTTTLKVRDEANTESKVLTLVPIEEELEVVKELDEWVKVKIDQDEGYVSKEFVKLSYELKKAVFTEELAEGGSSGVSSLRATIVANAKKYVGNPYVWGGTSLTNGADCSGFTQALYRQYAGVSINRTSGAQASNGVKISASSARPGDLIFYGNSSGINHVAMYIGNGQVIHASNPRSGIKISNMYYRTPVTARRIIND